MRASTPTIVWFRQDLRLADHPALQAAIARKGPVIPVFVWAPEEDGAWAPGAASRSWLHHSLASLDRELTACGSKLVLRRGPTRPVLERLVRETGAGGIVWNRRYEPAAIARDTQLKVDLRKHGIDVESFNGRLLFETCDLRTKAGQPFKVFTPFWKHCQQREAPAEPLDRPRTLVAPTTWPESEPLDALRLLPRIPWDRGFYQVWQPGRAGAEVRLARFLGEPLAGYDERRNRPDFDGTSQFSPHLHFGEISPREIWHAARQHAAIAAPARGGAGAKRIDVEPYLRQLVWREFAYHLLYHQPHTPEEPLRPEFARFPWREAPAELRAWQRGQTGYPIVDAGMRQLWTTGWMHNRVRMIVGSFLVKDLLLPWQAGARWFWDTLVDADLANNTLGWQWIAGTGADAAPYFRVFNPVLQGEKFDPDGAYVRTWVPELAALPNRLIHQPWAASTAELRLFGLELGQTYPRPLVDHAAARERALAALATLGSAARADE